MTEPNQIRVMVVDDHAVVRSGIRFSLLAVDDMELVGEAANGREALRLCNDVEPDVILMDMIMPGMDGVAATRAIREQYPNVQVIALSSFEEGDLILRAMQAGAIGYLLKDVEMEQLVEAIRKARGGQTMMTPQAARALAEAVTPPSRLGHDLTEREREVLALLVDGKSNAEIAEELGITLYTARFHVSTILDKLDAANRTQAAMLAVRHGLIS